MNEVVDNPNEQRFELPIEGGNDDIAVAYYRTEDGRFILIHTEVPYQFTGQGIGSQLAQGVFELIRAQGGKAVLRCPFMGRYYARYPDYSDIVIG